MREIRPDEARNLYVDVNGNPARYPEFCEALLDLLSEFACAP